MSNSSKKQTEEPTKEEKFSSSGILTFSFGFLGLSIVGLSSYLKDFTATNIQISSINLIYVFQLLIFHIFLFRYLLGNLAYLFASVSEGDKKFINSNQIHFFLIWIFILIQFVFIIIMGLSVRSNVFLYAFTSLIGSELLWSLFVMKDKGWRENISRVLMICIETVLVFLIIFETNNINMLLIALYILILLDCLNDLFKNKDNYSSILTS